MNLENLVVSVKLEWQEIPVLRVNLRLSLARRVKWELKESRVQPEKMEVMDL